MKSRDKQLIVVSASVGDSDNIAKGEMLASMVNWLLDGGTKVVLDFVGDVPSCDFIGALFGNLNQYNLGNLDVVAVRGTIDRCKAWFNYDKEVCNGA